MVGVWVTKVRKWTTPDQSFLAMNSDSMLTQIIGYQCHYSSIRASTQQTRFQTLHYFTFRHVWKKSSASFIDRPTKIVQ